MKTLQYLFVTVLLTLMSISTSHTQLNMVDPANEWNILYSSGFLPPIRVYTVRYTFSRDSILLDGKYFHELLSTRTETGNIDNKTGMFFRQERGKVWIKESIADSSVLIYDFSLELKDTFIFKYTPHDHIKHIDTLEIGKIDTITMMDGSNRKQLSLNNIKPPRKRCQITWIEGMGTKYAGFMNFNLFCLVDAPQGVLLCFKHNDKLLYQKPSKGGCYVVAAENPEITDLKLYPNPTSDRLIIKTDYKIESIKIYDLNGQLIRELQTSGKAIDIKELNSGVYFMRITTMNGYHDVKKFIKE